MKNPKAIFLTGVAGSGKTTNFDYLLATRPDLFRYVCSFTSRPMREWEVDGKRYFFVSREQFEQAIQEDAFIEYAQANVHHGYYYGTKKKPILDALADGVCPIKEIEVEIGLQTIITNHILDTSQYISIFLDIPDDVMKQRILARQPDIDAWLLASKLGAAHKERSIANALGLCIIDASQPLEMVQKTLLETIEFILAT